MYHRAILSALIIFGLSACTGYQRPSTAFHEALTDAYRLDAGDELRVSVYGQTELTRSYKVDQAGYITMPLINFVPAKGQTTNELESEITKKLSNGYMRNPDVTVEVATYRPFFIMGEVQNAGQYPYVAGMTAQTAVAIGGGFTSRARQGTVDVTRQINGEVLTGKVPITDPLRPGDTVFVRERLF
ncbi:MAG: polysaccharide biosynthesis/export family protein [Stappiaceae bacterium]